MKFTLLSFIPLFVALFIQSAFAGNDDKLISTFNLTTSPGKKLSVNVYAGGVKIETWGKHEVEVKVYGNENDEKYMSYRSSSNNEGVLVKSDLKSEHSSKRNLQSSALFVISVPKDYTVDVITGGGNLSVANLIGEIKLNSSGGNVKLSKITGRVDVSTGGGNLKYDNIIGDIMSATSGGNVKITDFNGNLNVTTSGGNMELQGTNGEVIATTSGGNIKLKYTGRNQGISLVTAAGNINVSVPETFDADADLYTSLGNINSDFAKVDKETMSSVLKIKLNNGGNELKCKTSAGNITLTK